MNKLLFIYDDSKLPSETLSKVIGNVKFSQIIHRRLSLIDRLKAAIMDKCEIVTPEVIKTREYSDYSFVLMPSSSVITNVEEFRLLLDKLVYSKNSICIYENEKILLSFYKDKDDFEKQHSPIMLDNYCLTDISNYLNLIRYLSESPDSRFFNTVISNDYLFRKISTNKAKIRNEYNFAKLIPDSMKRWIIIPYNFKEDDKTASYEMERIDIPDMAIRWIHNAISLDEFKNFLDKFFYFIASRTNRAISIGDYREKMNELYLNKVLDRILMLKNTLQYKKISEYVVTGTEYNSIDDIIEWYSMLYKKIIDKYKFHPVSVIGHGDPFFANMFYDHGTKTLKFIDPKGAEKEEELWTDPYYDVAKLSHSILGNYDFITNGLFSIQISNDLCFSLSIDNFLPKSYSEIFLKKAERAGFNPCLIRLFEASLFLSMLPLHIDNPKNVLAFILNSVQILKEVQNA